MNIIIRNATINDVEKIADIKIEGWQTAYRGIVDDSFLDNMNRNEEIKSRKEHIENGAQIIVAEINNEVVGFCLYRNFNKNSNDYPNADCEISALYVKSSLKRNGIGKKLMQYAIDELKERGKTQMFLGCLEENYPSRAFYEKIGGEILKYDKMKLKTK